MFITFLTPIFYLLLLFSLQPLYKFCFLKITVATLNITRPKVFTSLLFNNIKSDTKLSMLSTTGVHAIKTRYAIFGYLGTDLIGTGSTNVIRSSVAFC